MPPRHPDDFEQDIKEKHFTNGRVDADLVAELYRKVWDDALSLVNELVFTDPNWTDDDLEQLLAVAPHLPALQTPW